VLLHWTTVALLLLGVGAILLREIVHERELRFLLLLVHRSCGLLVLVLTSVRIVASPWTRTVAVDVGFAARWLARVAHAALMGVLVALAMVGWALSSALGQAVVLFGAIPLPAIAARDRDLADSLQDAHETLAIVLLAIVALHVAAALWHHFRLKDGVLRAMLPPIRRPSS
jgi:cytochrome b561